MDDSGNIPEQSHEHERASPTIIKRIGQTTLGILGAYIGIKIGEDIAHFAMPLYEEMGIATAVGSAAINARFASK